ncbi:MAG: hypothetical protein HOP97_07920, partial [Terrabacter sp.]|nr:hypothetical protein [Terrabacter sp.]
PEDPALQSLLDASIARSTGHLRWTAHYGSSTFSWGDDTGMCRLRKRGPSPTRSSATS